MRSLQRSIKAFVATGGRQPSFGRRRLIKVGVLLTSLGVVNLACLPSFAQQTGKPATQEDVLTYSFMEIGRAHV